MKIKVLAAVLFLSGLFVTVGIIYACGNQSPEAVLEVFREYVILGRSVTLDGSSSTDPDGSITKYEWDFNYSGTFDANYTEFSALYPDGEFDGITTHKYKEFGEYAVALIVTDDDSATDGTVFYDVNVSPDLDGDNLPKGWEDLYDELDDDDFSDANEDNDSDGYNNLCEYLHGTEPNNSASEPNNSSYNITIYVPGDVNTIQRAINAAIDGDTIEVSMGTYYENIDFNDMNVSLTSTDPNDWYIVASTIISAYDSDYSVVEFDGSEDCNCVLKGFTITGGEHGIFCDGTSPLISNCVITDNHAILQDGSYQGGGIRCIYSASPTIANCFISDNSATYYGGGVYNGLSSPLIINCVFSGNTANHGGGMCNTGSDPSIINCTFNGNSAENNGLGSGIYNPDNYPETSEPNVTNCIIWGNHGSSYEIYDGDPNVTYSDVNDGPEGTGNINVDPGFIDSNEPAGEDGIFGTIDDGLRVRIYSNCLDAGDPNADSNDVGTVDIGGYNRFMDGDGDGNSVVDMGAYELPLIWFVDKDAGSGGGGTAWYDAFDDLQDAIAEANDDDQIWVAEGTYKPTGDSNALVSFELAEKVGIYGGFAGTEYALCQRDRVVYETVLSGNISSNNSYHVVEINTGADGAVLDGFTITGGDADGSGADAYGGGIYCHSVAPVISNCTITDNSADGYGGGMYIEGSSPKIINCAFSQNEANSGAALTNSGQPILTNCVFVENEAVANGGAIYNDYSKGSLINCTFTKNQTTGGHPASGGGGMYNSYSFPSLTNCIFWENDCYYSSDYDQIRNSNSTPVFRYCDVRGSGGSDDWDTDFGTDDGGNIDLDPNFADANNPSGWDGAFGTYDDGLRTTTDGNCIDAADGFIAYPIDMVGLERVDINDANNTGTGDPNYADMGAYESYSGYGTNSDTDDLSDIEEEMLGTDPSKADTDGDGIDDDDEFNTHRTSPTSTDSDGDGLSDYYEIYTSYTSPLLADTDSDGMDDGWEVTYGFNPNGDDADDDKDGDGKTNLAEYQAGTHPLIYTIISITVYEYDNAGQITKETIQDEDENDVAVTQYQYDELGQKWQVRRWADEDAADNTNDIITLTAYDERGNVKKTVQKGVGNTSPNTVQTGDPCTVSYYDALGRLIDVNDPLGGNTDYTYNAGGQVYQVTDPNGNITTNEYDNAGRLVKVTDGQNHYRVTSYDSLGRTIKQIAYDSGNNALMQTRFEYYGTGNVKRRAVMADADETSQISTTLDMVVDYNYADTNGLLIYETKYYASGTQAVTTYDYDGLGRRTETTDPCDNQTLLTYDVMGRLQRRQQIENDPLGSNDLTITTDYYYNSLGGLLMQIEKPQYPDAENDSSWHKTSYVYDCLGNRTSQTNPAGVLTTYSYDALSRLEQKVADYGSLKINQTTVYGYDRLGRQTSISGYANGSTEQETSYTYDALGRITNVQYPDGNDIDFAYNAAGRVIRRNDQRGIVTQYCYDGIYNMLKKTIDGNSVTDNAAETFTYDGMGRMLTAAKDVNSTTVSVSEIAYNDIGKITDTNETLFAGTKRETDYAYDQAGLLTEVIYPASDAKANITPDWQGRIDTVKWNTNTTIAEYKYIGSRVARRSYTYSNPDIIYEPTYDNLGRITAARTYTTSGDITDFDYEYDPNTYNISQQKYDHRTSPADPCTLFTYDNLDRLTKADYGIDNEDEVFTIDDLGNRTNVKLRDDSNEVYSVDNLTNRYNSVDSNSLTYDSAGNLTKDANSYEYEYDYENRIVKITEDGNDIAEFSYDALGRRIEKKDLIDPNNTRRYYHNYNWQVLCEYTSAGTVKQLYVYGNYIDEVLFSIGFGKTYYYVHDHLYSPVAIADPNNGAAIERYEYDAYGRCCVLDPDFTIDADGLSDYDNPYLFTGRRWDILNNGSLKIQYSRNRYYDHHTGRFLSHDPLGITPNPPKPNNFNITGQYKDGLNLYEYAISNPVNWWDSFGLICSKGMQKTVKKSFPLDIWIYTLDVKCIATFGYKWTGEDCEECKVKTKPWETVTYSRYTLFPPSARAGIRRSNRQFKANFSVGLSFFYDAWHKWGVKREGLGAGSAYIKKYIYQCCDCATKYAHLVCTADLKENIVGQTLAAAAIVAIVETSAAAGAAKVISIAKNLAQAAVF